MTPSDRENLAEVIELRSRLVPDTGSGPENSRSAHSRSADYGSVGSRSTQRAELVTLSRGSVEPDGLSEEEHEAEVRDTAVRFLARRARSSGELRAELLRNGYEDVVVEEIIEEFRRSLYLDDLGLARVTVEDLRERKRASRSQIRMKLRERRFDDEIIDTAISELDDHDEFELLRAAAEDRARKLVGLDRQVAERRLLGFLARRGWSGERAYRAAREALDGTSRSNPSTVRFQ